MLRSYFRRGRRTTAASAGIAEDARRSGDDAWKVALGYRFAPYFSLKGNYMNFGSPSDSFQGSGSSGNYKLHMGGFAPFAVGAVDA